MAKKKTIKRKSVAKPKKTAGPKTSAGAKKTTKPKKKAAGPKNPAKNNTQAKRDAAVVDAAVAGAMGFANKRPDFAVVGVGASAGGLDAFRKFFQPMPVDCGMAFVLVQHLDPTHTSRTAELLGSHTLLPVIEAADGMPVKPNRVYVIPPGAYLSISGNVLRLSEPIERRGVRAPIDFFFRSLAEDQQQRAICVILSGTGSDGTLGLREVKAGGGIVLAQDLPTTQFDGMPRSAMATGLVDYVLPPEQMADVLTRYVRHHYVNGDTPPPADQNREDLNVILAILRTRTKYDFSSYKKGTLSRRVQRRMGLRHIEKLREYAELLRAEPDEATALFKDLLIGVTNFFREPEAWPVLRDKVIRPLVADVGCAAQEPSSGIRKNFDKSPAGIVAHPAADTPLRIWVPGCATGEEAYSLAMLVIEELQAAGKNQDVQIFASDIDHDALSFARAGIYPENIAADVSPERLRQFFIKGEHTYRINKELRDSVVFAEQNLIGDPPFAKLDMISCRNLLIYLEADVQQRIIAMLHFALREGGYLFLGNSETISGQHDLFQPLSKKWRIYRRVGPLRPNKVTFPIVGGHRAPATPQLSAPPVALLGVSRLAQQVLLERYSPACVLVNRRCEVLYLRGPTDAYLQLPSGEVSTDLLAMAREGLRTRLRSLVQQAVDGGEAVATTARVRRNGKYHHVQLAAEPLRHPREAAGLVLVTFDVGRGTVSQPASVDVGHNSSPPESQPSDGKTGGFETGRTADTDADESSLARREREADQLVRQMEEELHSSREELQDLIEELETSNEEMKAANEEAVSINEELQSTNEELETSKEELQSLNEELTTVNNQLEAKVAEVELTSNDLNNLLVSTNIATVFLDRRFCIKRFTPATTQLMRLIAGDIGRPLSDIVLNFEDPDLSADAEAVLTRLTPIEKEIRAADGAWYVRRVLPYRTEDNRIDGVVLTLIDISDRKRAEEATRRLNVELSRQVERRTAQLAASDQNLQVAVSDRNSAETTLHNREEEFFAQAALELAARSELEKQLAHISEEERQRLGRELHDTLGQQIAAIGLIATNLHEQLAAASSPQGAQAERLLDTIDEAQQQVRALFKGLLPVEVDAGGLMSALADLAERTQSTHEIACRFECDDPVPLNDSFTATHLYRIAQEAVHNAVKHSGAQHIVVQLRDGTGITLQIRDDGRGISGSSSGELTEPISSTQASGLGLRIMTYRAQLIGGRLTIRPATPQGTIVECLLPDEPSK